MSDTKSSSKKASNKMTPTKAAPKNTVRVRVVHPVDGMTVGTEVDVNPAEYSHQIKHKSLEVI